VTYAIPDDVWKKGRIEDNTGLVWRKDDCTAWIKYDEYGNRDSKYGWEVDNIDPNGEDDIENKRPLHWKNNAAKSDGKTECPVTSSGNENVGI
jgi:hypothetical protein